MYDLIIVGAGPAGIFTALELLRKSQNPHKILLVEKGKPELIKADMVLLAMGFLKPEQPQFADNVFVAGDAANGASLVVRAMASGRKTAAEVDKFLNR